MRGDTIEMCVFVRCVSVDPEKHKFGCKTFRFLKITDFHCIVSTILT